MSTTYAMLFAALMLMAGCAPAEVDDGMAAGSPELQVDRTTARPGGEIRLTLTNRTAELIGYNLCVASLERRDGGQWAEVPDRPAEVCTMELRTLQPGGTDDFLHTVPATLRPGEYRFRTGVETPLGESQVGVVSNAFQVTQ